MRASIQYRAIVEVDADLESGEVSSPQLTPATADDHLIPDISMELFGDDGLPLPDDEQVVEGSSHHVALTYSGARFSGCCKGQAALRWLS